MNCQNCAHAKNELKLSPLIHLLPKTVSNKIRKLLNVFLKLDSNFVTKVKNLSGAQLNNFALEKLEIYFILNEQLTKLIYGSKLYSSKFMTNLKSF